MSNEVMDYDDFYNFIVSPALTTQRTMKNFIMRFMRSHSKCESVSVSAFTCMLQTCSASASVNATVIIIYASTLAVCGIFI